MSPASFSGARATLVLLCALVFGERDEIGFPAFYQSPNFRYLTGLSEPHAVPVITGRDASGHAVGTLFRRDRGPPAILFNGPLEDPAGELGARSRRAHRYLSTVRRRQAW